MAFTWKDKKDMFKGEGIYHLTFAVVNRAPLLGQLCPLSSNCSDGHIAKVELTDLGSSVYQHFSKLRVADPQMQILAKQVMPDHFHAVVWMKEGFEGSVKMVARSFSQGCSKEARTLAAKGREVLISDLPFVDAQSNCAYMDSNNTTSPTTSPYDCGNVANTLFSKPFIRTLAHAGQLRTMIDYVHANPDNAWMRRCHPDLYVIRRNVKYAGLRFDAMGKARLLDWPDR